VVFSVFSHHHFVRLFLTFGADTSLPLMTRRNSVCTRCVWSPKVYRGKTWRRPLASFVARRKSVTVKRKSFFVALPSYRQ
jgi:hypothetical protein